MNQIKIEKRLSLNLIINKFLKRDLTVPSSAAVERIRRHVTGEVTVRVGMNGRRHGGPVSHHGVRGTERLTPAAILTAAGVVAVAIHHLKIRSDIIRNY